MTLPASQTTNYASHSAAIQLIHYSCGMWDLNSFGNLIPAFSSSSLDCRALICSLEQQISFIWWCPFHNHPLCRVSSLCQGHTNSGQGVVRISGLHSCPIQVHLNFHDDNLTNLVHRDILDTEQDELADNLLPVILQNRLGELEVLVCMLHNQPFLFLFPDKTYLWYSEQNLL